MALTGSIPVTGSLIVNDVSPRREKKFLRFGGFFLLKCLHRSKLIPKFVLSFTNKKMTTEIFEINENHPLFEELGYIKKPNLKKLPKHAISPSKSPKPKQPDRNGQCPCNSGLKYKKCCMINPKEE